MVAQNGVGYPGVFSSTGCVLSGLNATLTAHADGFTNLLLYLIEFEL